MEGQVSSAGPPGNSVSVPLRLLPFEGLPVGPLIYSIQAQLLGWSLQIFPPFDFLSCFPYSLTHTPVPRKLGTGVCVNILQFPHRHTSCPLCTWLSPRICSYHHLSLALSKGFGDLGHGGCRVGTFIARQMRVLTSFWCLPHLDFPFQLGPVSQPKGKCSLLKHF